MPEYPFLALDEELGATTLDHVAEQGPGSTAEANERHSALELLTGQGDGLVDVVQLLGDVHIPREHLGVLAIVGRLKGVWEVRALLVDHLNDHAHGLGDDKNVGEDDGGVKQAIEAVDGL